jgi:murein DD-endopeptidase MepM/ murein hydrolase activator NlpD
MLSSLRKCHLFTGVARVKVGVIFASAAALAGCSADVSRFDLGYGDGARNHSSSGSYGTTGRTASADYGSAGYDRPSSYGGGSDVARSDLPPTPQTGMTTAAIQPQQRYDGNSSYGQQQGYGASSGYGAYQQRAPQYGGYSAAPSGAPYGNSTASQPSGSGYSGSGYAMSGAGSSVPPIASQGSSARGEMIDVRQGDTLYSLARQHGVSVADLKAANGLTSNDLRPGQQLQLPSGTQRSYATETARPPRENYETVAVRPVHSAPSADAPSDWTGSHTVRQGESLYAIARDNGVKLSDLERYNGISDSRKVMPGTVLKVPGQRSSTTVAEATPSAPAYEPPAYSAPSASAPATSTPPAASAAQTPSPTPGVVALGAPVPPIGGASTPQRPTMINGTGLAGPGNDQPRSEPERVARAETNTATDAVSPTNSQNSTAVAGFSKLRWPVAGKVVAGFGPRPDGTHNDGVNLAAPMGTDVHAAESGVVAYAGDELKGYGNLVLIRHDNGWVTAYAHADELLVKRGDQIKRGQVIAKAGRTGQVDQPQVHFELRQGQKPVDPTPFMERL